MSRAYLRVQTRVACPPGILNEHDVCRTGLGIIKTERSVATTAESLPVDEVGRTFVGCWGTVGSQSSASMSFGRKRETTYRLPSLRQSWGPAARPAGRRCSERHCKGKLDSRRISIDSDVNGAEHALSPEPGKEMLNGLQERKLSPGTLVRRLLPRSPPLLTVRIEQGRPSEPIRSVKDPHERLVSRSFERPFGGFGGRAQQSRLARGRRQSVEGREGVRRVVLVGEHWKESARPRVRSRSKNHMRDESATHRRCLKRQTPTCVEEKRSER